MAKVKYYAKENTKLGTHSFGLFGGWFKISLSMQSKQGTGKTSLRSFYALLCLTIFVIGCKRTSTNDNDGKANMVFVSEQTESDGYKWYRYQKNYGTDSIETAIVDKNGNYLSRIFSLVTYGCTYRDYSGKGFETSVIMDNPVTGEHTYGHGYIDENYEEKLHPEYGCFFGTERIGEQYFE